MRDVRAGDAVDASPSVPDQRARLHQEAQPMPAGQVVARGRRGVQAVPHRHPRVRRREDPRRELQHRRVPAGGG